jgi:hypothetical protein
MDDPQFRQTFAADPEGTLRAHGIAVPANANLAAIDSAELDARVDRLKDALGDDIGALYSDEAFEAVARDPERVLRLQEVMRMPQQLADSQLAAVAGGRKTQGETYRISAFDTIDW